ncbi:hypothetical protein VA599_23050, partial [Chromobacterium sp. TRC.1.1.SA]
WRAQRRQRTVVQTQPRACHHCNHTALQDYEIDITVLSWVCGESLAKCENIFPLLILMTLLTQ